MCIDRSVHNVCIEHLWVDVTDQVGAFWAEMFTELELQHSLNINKPPPPSVSGGHMYRSATLQITPGITMCLTRSFISTYGLSSYILTGFLSPPPPCSSGLIASFIHLNNTIRERATRVLPGEHA